MSIVRTRIRRRKSFIQNGAMNNLKIEVKPLLIVVKEKDLFTVVEANIVKEKGK